MKKLLHSRYFIIGLIGAVILFVVYMMIGTGSNNNEEVVTAQVESGAVRQLVSVSGIAEAEQTAELSFPTSGIAQMVNVKQGDVVEAGDILIELERAGLLADRQEAVANLQSAIANRDELLAGPTGSARDATTQSLERAQDTLSTIENNEAQKISNARRTLLSDGLAAVSNDPNEDAVAPTISGTYTCLDEGSYEVAAYSSNSNSGYSYRLSGIESGIFNASVDQPIAMGACGLRLQFDANSNYGQTKWSVEIPNTKSPSYITNRNAYALAQTQAQSAIQIAQRDVEVANANATDVNAPARSEAITRANAAIAQSQARIARIDANINDRILRAPFSGTVTAIDVVPGETVSNTPILTLLAEADFEVTARIPEIDIGKLLIGQKVEMVFDAKTDETLMGTIDLISLQAIEIDGVAYYEAFIMLPEVPVWMRSGLNADVDIVITENETGLRIPTRFLTKTETGYSVLLQQGEARASSSVEVVLQGNDGFVTITGVNEGDTVVAP